MWTGSEGVSDTSIADFSGFWALIAVGNGRNDTNITHKQPSQQRSILESLPILARILRKEMMCIRVLPFSRTDPRSRTLYEGHH